MLEEDDQPYYYDQCEEDADSFFDFNEEDCYKESFDVCHANGLNIQGWPTYGNYTITTDIFHMYWWPTLNKIDIYDLRSPREDFPSLHHHALTLKDVNLYFFGDKNGDTNDIWNIDFYTGEQVNKKVQHYLNLKVFI